MAEEVLVDALPYFDSGYDEPGVKQAVIHWTSYKRIALTVCVI